MKKQSSTPRDDHDEGLDDTMQQADKKRSTSQSNPPWTTTGKVTSPKFGAAGSGGAEYEPGPEGD